MGDAARIVEMELPVAVAKSDEMRKTAGVSSGVPAMAPPVKAARASAIPVMGGTSSVPLRQQVIENPILSNFKDQQQQHGCRHWRCGAFQDRFPVAHRLFGQHRACYQRRETGTRKRHQIEYFEDDKKVDRKQRKNEKWNEERCGSEEKGNAVFVKRSVRGASRCRGGHGEFS